MAQRNTEEPFPEQISTGVDNDSNLRYIPPLKEFIEESRLRHSPTSTADAWANAAEIVKRNSDDVIKRWDAEIDTLLVYAGLFSAVLTAFIVQSYPLLSPASPDPVVAALAQISAQLSSFSANPPFINSTVPPFQATDNTSSPPSRWPSCSLVAASVGITVKQWLHEYRVGASGTSREVARLRQRRLDGLRKWRVAEIVAALPVLLQLALALFGAGMLTLLWNLDHHTAAVVSVGAAIVSISSAVTAVLPWFYDDCSYLSPQSLAMYAVLESTRHAFQRFSIAARAYLLNTLGCVRCITILRGSQTGPSSLTPRQTWRAREQDLVRKSQGQLDAHTLSDAHYLSMEEEFTDTAAICALDFKAADDVYEYCERLCELHDGSTSNSSAPVLQAILSQHSNLWSALVGPITLAFESKDNRWATPVGQIYERAFLHYGNMELLPLARYARETASIRSIACMYSSITANHPTHRLSTDVCATVLNWYRELASRTVDFDAGALKYIRRVVFTQFCLLDDCAARGRPVGPLYLEMLRLLAMECGANEEQAPQVSEGDTMEAQADAVSKTDLRGRKRPRPRQPNPPIRAQDAKGATVRVSETEALRIAKKALSRFESASERWQRQRWRKQDVPEGGRWREQDVPEGGRWSLELEQLVVTLNRPTSLAMLSTGLIHTLARFPEVHDQDAWETLIETFEKEHGELDAWMMRYAITGIYGW
ncbi:hypothetical protein C8Q78DRAFT_1083890 [Trametes maxima]|nr:hypothetical protein C8Q78DRAFT_1083890 [Trametes maxima]